MTFIREDMVDHLAGESPFAFFHRQSGDVCRDKEGRITKRVEVGGEGFFVKLHYGVGWGEIFKNLLSGRLPILGAKPEYEAALKLQSLGLKTLEPVVFDQYGSNPATQKSLLVTEEITDYDTLEDITMNWPKAAPEYTVKKRMVERVAEICREMHGAGINHRDLYLCHFLLKKRSEPMSSRMDAADIHLIDLHRAQLRDQVPYRWHEKDLGGLYYSCLDIGLTERDIYRFLRAYFQKPLSQIFYEHEKLLRKARWRAIAIYERYHKRSPQAVPL